MNTQRVTTPLEDLLIKAMTLSPDLCKRMDYWINKRKKVPAQNWLFERLLEIVPEQELIDAINQTKNGEKSESNG